MGGVTGSRLGVKVGEPVETGLCGRAVQQLLEATHYAARSGRPSEMGRAG